MSKQDRFPAIILAGGQSRRMGREKTQMLLGGKPLIAHILHRLRSQADPVWSNAPTDYPLDLGLPNYPDPLPDRPGPLAGVLAGLIALEQHGERYSHILTVPGDTPFLPLDLVDRLSAEATTGTIILAASGGRTHPVIALWPRNLASDLKVWLDDPDHRRVFDFAERHPRVIVDFPMIKTEMGPRDPFFNINTPEDLAQAEALLQKGIG
ncbi:molybdenum cofactor guanylyltransferase MobA [Rhizobium sp. SL42]|uniref:molybdenum cofactor guanylyltransferase MobA n=1 Tax=Rhizobium sp. SL42 TaxID=2806346 RepID=UPI0023511060|nr:molybdenum cofactor guanylyltransferase MobA [Rhizobium sp. SL42]UJW74030.1 molybdenum cofactor guanylyltransferase [Rhizobium sp. SL42]